MTSTLAQLGGATGPVYGSQSGGGVLPKPTTVGHAVGYAVIGLVLLAAVFALVIKMTRRE
ncbi:MAG TPA: hypothetical protein PKE29_13720 [Phycisphaerales bacterium]|nr:hypothetical protein [Phycisphaerales bacterium]